MTEQEKLKTILKEKGLNYKKVSEITGHSYDSVKSMLQPGKPVPRWCKLLIHVQGL